MGCCINKKTLNQKFGNRRSSFWSDINNWTVEFSLIFGVKRENRQDVWLVTLSYPRQSTRSEASASLCHKSWLSKADLTWLILMSHKVCWIPHYELTWLIVLTWRLTRESLLYFDWLIVSWLTIVTSYDVMTFAHDSYYESWVSPMWLVWAHDLVYEVWLVNGMLCDDSYESSMDFTLWLTTSHRSLCSARWWVTRVRVVRRCLYQALGFNQGIGSSRNHLSTFLY